MPSSFGRSIAFAIFVFALTVSPYAHAAETTAVGINDPVADVVQLWTTVLSSIESLSQRLASVLQPQPSSLTFIRSAKQPAPNNSPPPATLAASAALATLPPVETATTSGSAPGTPSNPQQPQSSSPPTVTSNLATSDPLPAPAENASVFVTQNQLNAGLSTLGSSLRQLIAGGGNPIVSGYGAPLSVEAFAPSQRIDQLNNVTITNANLTASEIPPLDYLSLSGGSLSGDLSVTGNATTTGTSYFSGNVGIGTSSSQDALSVNGSTFLTNISAPTITANRLYANSGSLYWAGNVIAGAATGNWTSDGTNVWRTGGNVGIGTTTPSVPLSVVGQIAQSIGGQNPLTPPYQNTPITTEFSTAGSYADSSSGNIFHLSSYATNSGTAPTVAIFGEGVSNGSGSAWGGNFVGYSNSATANAQGVEIDYGVLTNGGTATGLLVAGAGNFAPSTAIQIQSNNTNAIPANGINFHYRSAQGTNPASNSLIETSGAVSLPLGIDFSSASFSSAAVKLPSSTASSSGIAFGADTDFYRTAANTLATDGGFRAGGSVAIGTTTSPTHALEVAGGTAGAETELLELWSPYNNGNTATGISFVNNSTEGALSGGAQIAAVRGTSGSSNLVFRVANTSSVLFEAMRVTSSGNVGIGTTTPGSLLSIQGVANWTTATSTFYSTGGINLGSGCFAIAGNCLGLGNLSGTLGIGQGGTGATSATGATTNLQFLNPASGAVARSLTSKLADMLNVKDFGATGNGVTDDTSAIQAALNVASSTGVTAYFPPGTYEISSPLQVGGSVFMDANATIQATQSMAAVMEEGSNGYIYNGTIQGGTLDANKLATDGLFMRSFRNWRITNIRVLNQLDNAIHLGDQSLVAANGYSFGALISNVVTDRTISTQGASSTGIFQDAATDSIVDGASLISDDVGVETLTGNNFYSHIHVYSHTSTGTTTIAFEDMGMGNHWDDDEADTVGEYGIFVHLSGTVIENCSFYNNTTSGLNGVVDAIHFDASTPTATIVNNVFDGASANNQFLKDVDASSLANIQSYGNQDINVENQYLGSVNAQAGFNYQMGGIVVLNASSTLFDTEVGLNAAPSITTGTGDTATGYDALQNATSSSDDSAYGYEACLGSNLLKDGGNNSCFGANALQRLSIGGSNSVFGQDAGADISSGFSNTLLGQGALTNVTGGSSNVAVGRLALNVLNGSSANNTAVGHEAGNGNGGSPFVGTGGSYFGYESGFNIQSGSDYNTLLGFQSGYNVTTGWGNVLIGAASTTANANLTTGSNNIAIGNNISLPSATANGQLDIGNLLYGTGLMGTGKLSAGNIGIGTSTPYSRLEVWGPDSGASTTAFLVANSASSTLFYVSDNGNAVLQGGLTQTSDQRLKTNIQSLDASSSLSLIDQLNPVTFNWIDPNKGPAPQLGFIAQQVFPIFPNLVSTTSATALTPDGTLSLNYIDLISPIVSAIQALSAEITSIENTIAGFATIFHTQELCVGSTCVNQQQLAAVLASASQSPAGSSSSSSNNNSASSTPDTPPVIQINGDNPATVNVGDTYTDLGATITGPQADLNLGIVTYVKGTEMSPVQIDTSTAATDTIAYVVTDSEGLTSKSTRTVIVEAAATDGSSNAASSTTATSTTP